MCMHIYGNIFDTNSSCLCVQLKVTACVLELKETLGNCEESHWVKTHAAQPWQLNSIP